MATPTAAAATKRPEISIPPSVIADVRAAYGYSKAEALSAIATHSAQIYERAQSNSPKRFWSSLDTQGLYVLLDSHVLTADQGKLYIAELKKYEEFLNDAKLPESQQLVLDRLAFFFQFCFAKQSLRSFNRRLLNIVAAYNEEQYQFMERLLDIAIKAVAQAPDNDDFLALAVHEVLQQALELSDSQLTNVPVERLNFVKSSLVAYHKQFTAEFDTATATAAPKSKSKSKRRQHESDQSESESGSGSETASASESELEYESGSGSGSGSGSESELESESEPEPEPKPEPETKSKRHQRTTKNVKKVAVKAKAKATPRSTKISHSSSGHSSSGHSSSGHSGSGRRSHPSSAKPSDSSNKRHSARQRR